MPPARSTIPDLVQFVDSQRRLELSFLTVPSAELGTPFNEEIERLQRLVDIAEGEGARVALKTEVGCLSEDPDTVKNLCDKRDWSRIDLDPSHFWVGPHRNKNYDKLMK